MEDYMLKDIFKGRAPILITMYHQVNKQKIKFQQFEEKQQR